MNEPTKKPDKSRLELLIHNAQLKSKALKENKPANYYIELEKVSNEQRSNPEVPIKLSLPSGFDIVHNLGSSDGNTVLRNHEITSGTIGTSNQIEGSGQIARSDSANSPERSLTPTGPVLNKEQQAAVELGLSGKSFVLIGPAGSGKTFTVNYILQSLIANNKLARMTEETRTLDKGDYGFLASAYTRRATAVVRKNLPPGLKAATCHGALEYRPERTTRMDGDGNMVNSMRFVPGRTKYTPLPSCISTVVLDESSMISTELHQEYVDALPHRPQIIYIGDLAQLKPVFGDAILGYKLNELPVIELTQIYRQKDGEILDFATDIRKGINITNFTTERFKNDRLKIMQFKGGERDAVRLAQLGSILEGHLESGDIDPFAGDLILCPQNVGVGNIELNKYVADYYDRKHNRRLYTIIAGFKTLYFAVGDKILVDRNDAIITMIEPNPKYIGRLVPVADTKINRWGGMRIQNIHETSQLETDTEQETTEDDFEAMLLAMGSASLDDMDDARVNEASHIIHYEFIDPDVQTKAKYAASLTPESADEFISSAGDINKLELAYCISVHKSQGSQANHVMILLARQHGRMLTRELLYTAVTRAAKKLTIYSDVGCISKAIMSPSIKGDTIAEKAEFFKGREERKRSEKQ